MELTEITNVEETFSNESEIIIYSILRLIDKEDDEITFEFETFSCFSSPHSEI